MVRLGDEPVFVPFVLPGERVRLGARAELLAAAAERVAPACRHFGVCGGCRLQHWADEPYRAWKRGLVVAALARAGFDDAKVAALVPGVPGTRRRLDLAVRRAGQRVELGLHARGSADVVDLRECPITAPSLVTLLEPMRGLLAGLGVAVTDAQLNLLDTGPDLLLRAGADVSTANRSKLAAFARAWEISRISWAVGRGAPEVAVLLERPVIRFGGVGVTPPPGAFLQASAEAEAAILDAVLAALPERGRVLDLYAGVGTLSFPIARRHEVVAVEGDGAAAAALDAAARTAGGRVRAVHRDLVRQPMMGGELRGVAAVVLDPPFGGAREQVAALAEAGVKRVVMVSCNPQALARDGSVLRAAGYVCESAVPIDAFLWAADVETVAVFTKARSRQT